MAVYAQNSALYDNNLLDNKRQMRSKSLVFYNYIECFGAVCVHMRDMRLLKYKFMWIHQVFPQVHGDKKVIGFEVYLTSQWTRRTKC